jgi:hypothetical protein
MIEACLPKGALIKRGVAPLKCGAFYPLTVIR